MSTRIETIFKATREWLSKQGYISESDFTEDASLGFDSFAYLALIIYLEDTFNVAIKADLFFEQSLWEEDETFISLCRRLQKSIGEEQIGTEMIHV